MRVIVIPLAGRGKRFADEGYTLPKPLIPVNGIPMVIRAAKALPIADKYIFICLKDHIKNYQIDQKIKRYYHNATIISLDSVSEGQVSTCILSEKHIDQEDELIISACDNAVIYSKTAYNALMHNKKTDAIVWTFRNNPNVLRHPKHWGWVVTDQKNLVEKVSVKIPLSKNPLNDHAVVGCFSFKKAKFFFENAKKMIATNRRIKGEFYIDECMNLLVENKLQVKVFEVDRYIGWGTPADLKTYEYWNAYFKQIKK